MGARSPPLEDRTRGALKIRTCVFKTRPWRACWWQRWSLHWRRRWPLLVRKRRETGEGRKGRDREGEGRRGEEQDDAGSDAESNEPTERCIRLHSTERRRERATERERESVREQREREKKGEEGDALEGRAGQESPTIAPSSKSCYRSEPHSLARGWARACGQRLSGRSRTTTFGKMATFSTRP